MLRTKPIHVLGPEPDDPLLLAGSLGATLGLSHLRWSRSYYGGDQGNKPESFRSRIQKEIRSTGGGVSH